MRSSIIVAITFEIIVGYIVLYARNNETKLIALLWMCGVFVTYRIGMSWIGTNSTCPCLANVSQLLRISDEASNAATALILAYLIIGSAIYLAIEVIMSQKVMMRRETIE
jgi:hypothetical protein